MISDAYGTTSGAVDAFVMILVYGAIAGFVWFLIAQTKRHRTPKYRFEDEHNYSASSTGLTASYRVPPTSPDSAKLSIPDSKTDVMASNSNDRPDVTKDLMALARLFEKGLLTPGEFASAKSKLLEQT